MTTFLGEYTVFWKLPLPPSSGNNLFFLQINGAAIKVSSEMWISAF